MINKRSWILVGIFLWGLPTALACAIITTFTNPRMNFQFRDFQIDIFLHNVFIYFPIFISIGMLLGLFMYRLSPNNKKNESSAA
ncbi:MAG: hypothetical protein KC733_09340 [Candidatus Omnitrophica bacterium]|nr:hypothetical protein [Candidatus Omnitrophota bacterium]